MADRGVGRQAVSIDGLEFHAAVRRSAGLIRPIGRMHGVFVVEDAPDRAARGGPARRIPRAGAETQQAGSSKQADLQWTVHGTDPFCKLRGSRWVRTAPPGFSC